MPSIRSRNSCALHCTNLRQLTSHAFKRRFARKGVSRHDHDATKKQPTTGISELQEFDLEYQIRQRAYEHYEARGRQDGHDEEDWLRAEAEITNKKARTVAA
jgi:hypothetical protein